MIRVPGGEGEGELVTIRDWCAGNLGNPYNYRGGMFLMVFLRGVLIVISL